MEFIAAVHRETEERGVPVEKTPSLLQQRNERILMAFLYWSFNPGRVRHYGTHTRSDDFFQLSTAAFCRGSTDMLLFVLPQE